MILSDPTPGQLFEAHARCAEALYGGRAVRGPRHARVVGVAGDDPDWRFAVLLGEPLDRALDEALATTAGGGEVIASGFPGEPAGLRAHLEARGWTRIFRQHWLTAPAAGGPAPAVEGITLRELATPEDAEAFVAVFSEVHGGGSAWTAAVRRGLDASASSAVRHLLARAEDETVGIASLVGCGNVAGLYNLAVRAPWRRRGLGRALTVRRQQIAGELGGEHVLLVAEAPRVAVWHERHGFRDRFCLEGWAEPAAGVSRVHFRGGGEDDP